MVTGRWRDLGIDPGNCVCEWCPTEHRAVRVQHRRQRIWATGFRHGTRNARQFRERRKGWRAEEIDIESRKDIGLVAMISKGSVGTERFVSRVAI
jgi:hypothetical protein